MKFFGIRIFILYSWYILVNVSLLGRSNDYVIEPEQFISSGYFWSVSFWVSGMSYTILKNLT